MAVLVQSWVALQAGAADTPEDRASQQRDENVRMPSADAQPRINGSRVTLHGCGDDPGAGSSSGCIGARTSDSDVVDDSSTPRGCDQVEYPSAPAVPETGGVTRQASSQPSAPQGLVHSSVVAPLRKQFSSHLDGLRVHARGLGCVVELGLSTRLTAG